MAEHCIFCKIIAGEIQGERVYEDKKTLAFLDIKPVSRGHTLLVPKEHYDDLLASPDDTLTNLIATVKKIGRAVKEAFKADGFNIAVNNGRSAGQSVEHVHFHIIPRYQADDLQLWQGRQYGHGEAAEVGKILRSKLR